MFPEDEGDGTILLAAHARSLPSPIGVDLTRMRIEAFREMRPLNGCVSRTDRPIAAFKSQDRKRRAPDAGIVHRRHLALTTHSFLLG